MTSDYDPATRPCAPGTTAGCKALQHSILGHWHNAGATNVGTFVCRNNADGAPSVHGNGRAGDIGRDARLIQEIADWLVANHDALGVQLVIVNHKIWSVARAAEHWRPYGCDTPGSKKDHHDTHVHYEVNIDAGRRLTPGIIHPLLPGHPGPPPMPGDDMPLNDDDKKLIQTIVYDTAGERIKTQITSDGEAVNAYLKTLIYDITTERIKTLITDQENP